MPLYEFDRRRNPDGGKIIAGLDEAGRGPIAGPVVAAAVVIPEGRRFPGLRDSKLVPEKEREVIYFDILAHAVCVGVGVSGVDAIERVNILQATKLAMADAVKALKVRPDLLMLDAININVDIPQESIIKGDAQSACIAAASIIAKYTRDAIMAEYHKQYPEYGFDRHKGYCTAEHIETLEKYGPSPIHRKTFRKMMNLSLPF